MSVPSEDDTGITTAVHYEESKKAFLKFAEQRLNHHGYLSRVYQFHTKKNIEETIAKKLERPTSYMKYVVTTGPDGKHILTLKRKSPNHSLVQILSWEDMFELFMPLHVKSGHRGREILAKMIKSRSRQGVEYKFPLVALTYFRRCCSYCNKSIVKLPPVKCYKISLVHVIAMTSTRKNEKFKYILIYLHEHTQYILLRPLKEKNHLEIGVELFKIFTQFGPPNKVIMHGYNSSLTEKIGKALADMCPAFKVELEHQRPKYELPTTVTDRIQEWMDRTKSPVWEIGCFIVQSEMNNDPRMTPPTLQHSDDVTPLNLLFNMPMEKPQPLVPGTDCPMKDIDKKASTLNQSTNHKEPNNPAIKRKQPSDQNQNTKCKRPSDLNQTTKCKQPSDHNLATESKQPSDHSQPAMCKQLSNHSQVNNHNQLTKQDETSMEQAFNMHPQISHKEVYNQIRLPATNQNQATSCNEAIVPSVKKDRKKITVRAVQELLRLDEKANKKQVPSQNQANDQSIICDLTPKDLNHQETDPSGNIILNVVNLQAIQEQLHKKQETNSNDDTGRNQVIHQIAILTKNQNSLHFATSHNQVKHELTPIDLNQATDHNEDRICQNKNNSNEASELNQEVKQSGVNSNNLNDSDIAHYQQASLQSIKRGLGITELNKVPNSNTAADLNQSAFIGCKQNQEIIHNILNLRAIQKQLYHNLNTNNIPEIDHNQISHQSFKYGLTAGLRQVTALTHATDHDQGIFEDVATLRAIKEEEICLNQDTISNKATGHDKEIDQIAVITKNAKHSLDLATRNTQANHQAKHELNPTDLYQATTSSKATDLNKNAVIIKNQILNSLDLASRQNLSEFQLQFLKSVQQRLACTENGPEPNNQNKMTNKIQDSLDLATGCNQANNQLIKNGLTQSDQYQAIYSSKIADLKLAPTDLMKSTNSNDAILNALSTMKQNSLDVASSHNRSTFQLQYLMSVQQRSARTASGLAGQATGRHRVVNKKLASQLRHGKSRIPDTNTTDSNQVTIHNQSSDHNQTINSNLLTDHDKSSCQQPLATLNKQDSNFVQVTDHNHVSDHNVSSVQNQVIDHDQDNDNNQHSDQIQITHKKEIPDEIETLIECYENSDDEIQDKKIIVRENLLNKQIDPLPPDPILLDDDDDDCNVAGDHLRNEKSCSTTPSCNTSKSRTRNSSTSRKSIRRKKRHIIFKKYNEQD